MKMINWIMIVFLAMVLVLSCATSSEPGLIELVEETRYQNPQELGPIPEVAGERNVAGYFLQFPKLRDVGSDGNIQGGFDLMEFTRIYQGIIASQNLILDTNFEANSRNSGSFINTALTASVWRTNQWPNAAPTGEWKGEAPFDAAGNEPPLGRAIHLLPLDRNPQIMQRFYVEPGSWYFVSAWIYAENDNNLSLQVSSALFSEPGPAQPGARARIATFDAVPAGGEWTQFAYIIQVPDNLEPFYDPDSGEQTAGVLGPRAYMDIRFQGLRDPVQSGNAEDIPNTFYITNVEVYQLLEDSVGPFTGVFGEPSRSIVHHDEPPIVPHDPQRVAEILAYATQDVEDFRFVFNIHQGNAGPQIDWMIENLGPYLRDGDVILQVSGNGIAHSHRPDWSGAWHPVTEANVNERTLDMTEVETSLERLRNAFPDINIHYLVYTNGYDNIETVISELSPQARAQIAGITSGYEPFYLLEFSFDFIRAREYYTHISSMIKGAGFSNVGTAVTGGALNPSNSYIGYNYAALTEQVDEMIIQTQTYLVADSTNRDLDINNYMRIVINPLVQQFGQNINRIPVYPQVTVGTARGDEADGGASGSNAASLLYCIQAVKAMRDAGFAGASLWWTNPSLDNCLEIVRTMRVRLDR